MIYWGHLFWIEDKVLYDSYIVPYWVFSFIYSLEIKKVILQSLPNLWPYTLLAFSENADKITTISVSKSTHQLLSQLSSSLEYLLQYPTIPMKESHTKTLLIKAFPNYFLNLPIFFFFFFKIVIGRITLKVNNQLFKIILFLGHNKNNFSNKLSNFDFLACQNFFNCWLVKGFRIIVIRFTLINFIRCQ